MDETWKSIKNFEGIYEVSNFGSVRRIIGDKYRYRKIVKGKGGYSEVILSKNNKITLKRVHRLVAEAFIPNPKHFPQVNHKNGDKSDNKVANLEWISPRNNQIHSHRVLLKTVKSVLCVEKNIVYPSMTIAAEKTKTNLGHICDVINHHRKTAGGYHWKLANN